jgi:hypothetical protein
MDARQGATIRRHAQSRRRCHATAGAWGAGGRDEARTRAIRSAGRLGLLLVGLLTLATYARSDAPVEWPANHARYLLPLLLATPCLVWALWRGMGTFEGIAVPPALARLARLPQKTRRLLCGGVLAVSMALLGTGTLLTFGEVPFVQSENHQNMHLIAYLEQHGVKHIYTGYWDCDSLAFLSEERVQCAVVGPSLAFSHNRYTPYLTATVADPYAAYVFRHGSAYENPVGSERVLPVEEKLREQGMSYQHVIVDGFIVYLPGPTPGRPGAGR